MLLFLGQMRASWGQTPCSPKRERIVQATKPRVFCLFVSLWIVSDYWNNFFGRRGSKQPNV